MCLYYFFSRRLVEVVNLGLKWSSDRGKKTIFCNKKINKNAVKKQYECQYETSWMSNQVATIIS